MEAFLKAVFNEDQIRSRVRELGQQISKDYGDSEVHAVGILDNGFMFLADLVREMTCPVICHFSKMDTVDTAVEGHQPLRNILYGSVGNVKDKHLLLVDVMIDSGITLDHLAQQLLLKKAKSVKTAVMVDREDRRRVPLIIDYAGFKWSGGHLAGYGLEKGGLFRNLPYLAEIAPAS
ncbi:MAG: hypothetical protein A3F68_12015 [Acidobacteria bacterium RIFCSPLOWO2_12_FULL_54_10]|nr:MAG: hypothetical protein A3F68_12015 [Acidobacteria bacterium RIFCSPLOWO2_12_FULL_54_10]